MSMREREVNKIAQMYLKYLNGPLGKGVMEYLKEGESFTIRAHEELLRISKSQGKAVVRVLQEDHPSKLKSHEF
ncbi:MAG: hypothetical protein E4H14_07625 [Candidatus Thorarchaeota archaeon]|nr:MAG: hypothetical protein E4H14_07625 [Candidatus Thorarchaeota archaeon]